MKRLKTKIVTLSLFSLLFFMLLVKTNKAIVYDFVGDDISFKLWSGLCFQNDMEKNVSLTVVSGVLETTDNQVRLYEGGGHFRFSSLKNVTLRVNYSRVSLKVSGDQDNDMRVVSPGSNINIISGDNILFTWSTSIPPLLPLMFLMGMIGLSGMIGSPLYSVYLIHQGRIKEGFRFGVIWTAASAALFVAWVW